MPADPGAWLKAHKLQVGGVAVGAVAFIALRSKSSAAAAAAPATSSTADTSALDTYNQLEGQISSLQAALAGLGTTSPSAPLAPTSPGGGSPSGGGAGGSQPSQPPVTIQAPGSTFTPDGQLHAPAGASGVFGGIPYTGTPSGVPVVSGGPMAGDYVGISTVSGAPILISKGFGLDTNATYTAPPATLAQGNATPGHGEGNIPGSPGDIAAKANAAWLAGQMAPADQQPTPTTLSPATVAAIQSQLQGLKL